MHGRRNPWCTGVLSTIFVVIEPVAFFVPKPRHPSVSPCCRVGKGGKGLGQFPKPGIVADTFVQQKAECISAREVGFKQLQASRFTLLPTPFPLVITGNRLCPAIHRPFITEVEESRTPLSAYYASEN